MLKEGEIEVRLVEVRALLNCLPEHILRLDKPLLSQSEHAQVAQRFRMLRICGQSNLKASIGHYHVAIRLNF